MPQRILAVVDAAEPGARPWRPVGHEVTHVGVCWVLSRRLKHCVFSAFILAAALPNTLEEFVRKTVTILSRGGNVMC